MNKKIIDGTLCTCASAMIFGVTPLIVTFLLAEGATPMMGSLFRALLHMPFTLLIMLRTVPKERRRLTKRQWWDMLVVAITYGGTSALLFFCYGMVGTGLATALHFCYPMFTALICALFYREKITRTAMICVFLSVAGVALCCNLDGSSNLTGILLSLLTGVIFATYMTHTGKSSVKDLPNITVVFYSNLLMVPLLGIVAVFMGQFSLDISPMGWGIALFFSVMNTLGAVFLLQRGILLIGPQKSSIYCTIEPMTAVLVGGLFLREAITPLNYLGIAVILTAVLLMALQTKKE